MSAIQDRREKRALEAKRDKLLELREKARADLAKVRTELKLKRKPRRGAS